MESFVSVRDFEDHFETLEPLFMRYYVNSAAGLKVTLGENQRALRRLRIIPRVLADVSEVDTSTTMLGQEVSMPINVAASGGHCFYWHDGERSTFEAVEKSGVCGVLSNFTTTPLKEVERVCPSGRKWLNMCLWEDRKCVASVLKNAEQCGFTAVVVTVDQPVMGKRIETWKFPLPVKDWYPLLSRKIFDPAIDSQPAYNPSANWKDIDWLKTVTDLPIVVKGILTPGDAVLAVEHGAAAILVSNHGGRQLDTVPATIEVLPDIVDAVDGRVEVYMDGGIRTGTDVVKALAIGARAVFIGRPVLWGLAGWGSAGVLKILQILEEELRTAMALLGCSNLRDIDRSKVLMFGPSRL